MLALSANHNLISAAWEAADETVKLPESFGEDFLDKRGRMPLRYENRRTYHRYYMRGKAILKRGDSTYGIYTKDISRTGIGLLAPEQLLPLERVRLQLPDGSELDLEVSRCRRVEKFCFDCGTRFLL